MKLITALVLTLALGSTVSVPDIATAQPVADASPPSCAPVGDLSFVCGVTGVEDFVPVEGGRWLVGSSLKLDSVGLYLIDTTAKTAAPVVLSISSKPDPLFAGCAAPDLKRLKTHGLDVTAGRGGRTTVYVINKQDREAVEVFSLNPAAGSAEWVGCVTLPPGTNGNAIAILPKGAFVVSKYLDDGDKDAGFRLIRAGQVSGVVYHWTPGAGFREVPGTRLSGDNGVLVSADQQWLFLNAYGTHEIYRLPLSGTGKTSILHVDFSPDNLRWAPGGKIFVTGQFLTPERPDHLHDWTTLLLDPKTLALKPVLKQQGYPQFDNGTSTVQVGDTLWIGTYSGDRVAYLPAPLNQQQHPAR